MPPMPYAVTQGPILTALENAFNAGHPDQSGTPRSAKQTRIDTLNDQRAAIVSGGHLPRVGDGGDVLSDLIATHIESHWFGLDAAGNDANGGLGPTGWWVNWRGPAREIARQGMIIALEMSLGLDRDPTNSPITAEEIPDSHVYPMDFSWICPVPRFEVWVGSREWATSRIITVTLATPGYATGPEHPERPPMVGTLGAGVTAGDGEIGPATYEKNDHIVVGAEVTAPTVAEVSIIAGEEGTNAATWHVPVGIGVVAERPVIHVRVPKADGIDAEGESDPGVIQ